MKLNVFGLSFVLHLLFLCFGVMSISHIRISVLFELIFYVILYTFPACLTNVSVNYFTLLIVFVTHFAAKSEYEVFKINYKKSESWVTELLKR
jgi:hypothetical protein